MHEGPTDEAYFNILIPILMEDIVRRRGTRNVTVPQTSAVKLGKNGRSIQEVAMEICKEKEAFHILFIYADTGGRSLEAGMEQRSVAYRRAAHELCGFPSVRCVIIAPRHETEAWMLADPDAVGGALGFRGNLETIGLPASAAEAEQLIDPKFALNQAINRVRGRRSRVNVEQMISAIAHRQSLNRLRPSTSFGTFEGTLIEALINLGCVA